MKRGRHSRRIRHRKIGRTKIIVLIVAAIILIFGAALVYAWQRSTIQNEPAQSVSQSTPKMTKTKKHHSRKKKTKKAKKLLRKQRPRILLKPLLLLLPLLIIVIVNRIIMLLAPL
ncbi:hypothetical protein B8A32_04715 [Loigolactobacillus backii]|nr:hypothetical protein AYR55_11705 [Loigolactobacillus backii]OLF69379.1 hypothetical protein ACX53_08315 [Loigolactobacillus backii]PIO86502.1 hypothetical protein B8A32_04715 [Loigolactobacillus backii]